MSAARAASFFFVAERDPFDADLVVDVLRGRLACVVFRDFADAAECRWLLKAFLASPAVRRREGDATGPYLGTFHWGKRRDEYVEDAAAIAPAVDAVVGSPAGAWQRFRSALSQRLARDGVTLREATWGEASACTPIVRAWEGGGDYSLVPHDDLAQCSDPQQRGFEIQEVAIGCSVNLCIANAHGGELVLWDYAPSREDRRALGIETTGGPYPSAALDGHRRLDVHVREGTLYVFNGALVHAVRPTTGRRATVSTLVGSSAEDTVVMWT